MTRLVSTFHYLVAADFMEHFCLVHAHRSKDKSDLLGEYLPPPSPALRTVVFKLPSTVAL